MRMREKKLAQKAAACICMLAVALLYAPLAAAALVAPGMDCCVGGLCPVHGHHPKTQERTTPQNAMPMDCGHDMSGHKSAGMSECSMTACQSPEHPLAIPGAFVLPDATLLLGIHELVQPVPATVLEEISRLSKPLSPPPRSAASVL